ncbi:MAG: TPR end-of-group domain-containing protein [Pyrinomonadaceae bacterium]
MKEPQDSSERRVARRVIRSLLIGAYEQGEGRLRAEDYAGAVYHFEIATEIAPDNPRLFFSLACAQALAGQKGRALQTLRRAIEKGFKDLESITTNRALDSLRKEAVYIEIVNSLKKEP